MEQNNHRDLQKEPRTDPALVSVVIPCYNQAHFLSEAIESVLAQSYPNFEVVVVDDGSTDNTSELAARYPGVRCVYQDNQGLSEARNTGIRHSNGGYLVFLDADDRLLPEALGAGLKYFDTHPECALVFGHYRFIAADGSLLKELRSPHIKNDHYVALLRGPHIGMPALVMYRRFVFETVSWFNPAVNGASDYDLYMRIARKFPVHGHDTIVAEYRQHDTNMTRNAGIMLRDTVKVLRSQRGYAKKDKRHQEAYKAGMKFWQSWYGIPLVDRLRTNVRELEWRQATEDTLTLLRYHPRGLALLLSKRHRLAQQLQERNKQLQSREQQLQVHSKQLQNRNKQLRELREQNQRLERQVQNRERQLQDIRSSKSWRMLKKLAYVRSKLPRR